MPKSDFKLTVDPDMPPLVHPENFEHHIVLPTDLDSYKIALPYPGLNVPLTDITPTTTEATVLSQTQEQTLPTVPVTQTFHHLQNRSVFFRPASFRPTPAPTQAVVPPHPVESTEFSEDENEAARILASLNTK